jgi:2-keto-4-pentenoate hydratase/2-oxohepta-3-ene-1,7-dioic acid hydratase in catechol pathway
MHGKPPYRNCPIIYQLPEQDNFGPEKGEKASARLTILVTGTKIKGINRGNSSVTLLIFFPDALLRKLSESITMNAGEEKQNDWFA